MMTFMISIFTRMCLVVALSFIKLCDPSEMSFILVFSRSYALHQLNFYTGSQLCHYIHPQNKTPCLIISLSSIFQMRHGLYIYKKRERKDGMPKKHDPKKERKNMDTSMSMKKKEREKIYLAMSSCYPNKGERDSKKEYSISTIHLPHMCTILINQCDLSSPWILCLILQ